MLGFNGGLIGSYRDTIAQQSLPGIWTTQEQSMARRRAAWPAAGEYSLLLKGIGTNNSTSIIDSSEYGNPITVSGAAVISTAQSKNRTSSLYFPGGTDYVITSGSPIFGIGANDFTVEFWYYPVASSGSFPRIFEFNQGSAGTFQAGTWLLMDRGLTANYGFSAFNINSSGNPVFTSSVAVTNGAWVHLALVRNGTSIRLYVNGIDRGGTTSSASLCTGTCFVSVGGTPSGVNATTNAYIEDFAISNFAKYTTTFTTPGAL